MAEERGGAVALEALTPEHFRVSDKAYGVTLRLLRCADCQFLFAGRPAPGELEALYAAMDDTEYCASLESRRLQQRWLAERALALHPGARTALDIGAGVGLLVDELRRRGLSADGVEVSRSLVQEAAQRLGIDLVGAAFNGDTALPREHYDLIFMTDVIEHVDDPVGMLVAARDRLAAGGLIFLVTPDVESVSARAFGRHWWHYRTAHVSYFSRATLETAAEKTGLVAGDWYRPRWCLPLWYLIDRAASMVGLEVGRSAWLKRRFDVSVPFNLLDSWGLTLRRRSDRDHATGLGLAPASRPGR